MVTERAKKIAEAIQEQFDGDVKLDEIICDTLSGSEVWLTAIAQYFNERMKMNCNVSHESTMWMMIDSLIQNLEPREELPTMLKWYITHYELYCRTNWDLTTMLLDKLKEVGGREVYDQLADDEKFKQSYYELNTMEKRLNSRLEKDGLECLEAQIWKDTLKKDEQ